MEIRKLQNGSDIRGIALPGVPGEEVNLTPEIAGNIARSFARFLAEKTGKKETNIAVGMDPRLSGPTLSDAIEQGLLEEGCQVSVYGLATTPAMFFSTHLDGMDGAIMITASHLPPNRNGMKFFTAAGGLEKKDITRILDGVASLPAPAGRSAGKIRHEDFLQHYADHLIQFIRTSVIPGKKIVRPLEGYHILVDAGNGSGGFFATHVLEPLGADTSGSLFLEPDGQFPNHAPNPENLNAMEGLISAVKNEKADLGIIFDTDVDRAAIVDRDGTPVNRNRLIALISAILLKEHPGSWIVTDSITSDGLTSFIEKAGGHHHRYKRGYRNVINEAIRLNIAGKECHLAIETSGHAALKENFFLDDGAYLVARILAAMARLRLDQQPGLESLTKGYTGPVASVEFRPNILTEDFVAYGGNILQELSLWAAEQPGWQIVTPNYEGVRISCNPDNGDGWFLLRMSLHDPVMPLNIESNRSGGIVLIQERLRKFFSQWPETDAHMI